MAQMPDSGGFYMQYLASLCRRRGWNTPSYECYREPSGYTCLVLVNGREYQTDLAYESDVLAQENAAMRAFMVCRNFSVNGGMLARNGMVQGLPANDSNRRRKGRQSSGSSSQSHSSHGSHGSHGYGHSHHSHHGQSHGHSHHHHGHSHKDRDRDSRRSGHYSSSSSTASYE